MSRRTYSWSCGDPGGVMEPALAVAGPWEKAWRDRLERGTTWAHQSRRHRHDADCEEPCLVGRARVEVRSILAERGLSVEEIVEFEKTVEAMSS